MTAYILFTVFLFLAVGGIHIYFFRKDNDRWDLAIAGFFLFLAAWGLIIL